MYEDKLNELSSRELMIERSNKTVQNEIQKIRDGKLNEYIKGNLHSMMMMIIIIIIILYDDDDIV